MQEQQSTNAATVRYPGIHVLAVQRLRNEEAALVYGRVLPSLPIDFAPPPDAVTPKAKLFSALTIGLTQADLVLAIIRETAPTAIQAIESLIGKPIDHVPFRRSGLHPPQPTAPTRAPSTDAQPKPAAKARPVTVNSEDAMIIRLVATANPRKPGTAAFDRYAKYRDGMTVAEYLAAGDTSRGNVKCDVERGNIKLETP
jgi:hypothetical protein